ncbi:glyoxalase/bleomycin resistance/extradiol dioxygenase family protein [Longibacter salinarum]|uniref:Glyoxalase/bleomycin resistance/extradiol dioxygenase family protein n=1 Tax=Longibacter salinarum TaxID=1850348 RepID=A0A2A8D1W1_9BACT|nr:glyoxalase/bleomycin resistance/extradiol dioxygenase family protein [Longibacter salinarum]
MFQGLRTTIYVVDDLDRAKAWYAEALGAEPYFDEPFYVGFDVGGFELGLLPADERNSPGAGGTLTYWGVPDIEAAVERLVELGATEHDPIQDVGDGVKTATVLDPFGNVLGVIENPHFQLPDQE